MIDRGRGDVMREVLRMGRRALGAALTGITLASLAVIATSCSRDTQSSDSLRRANGQPEARRNAQVPESDTSSLITPVRGDSLIGAARGAGGVATLRAECAACHTGVHDVVVGRDSVSAQSCVACHARSHEPMQAFYSGAIRGAHVPADTMFIARVSCLGCHSDSTFALPVGATREAAYDAMCVSCHGRRFRGMLTKWRNGVTWREQAVSAFLTHAAADSRVGGAQAAREALALVKGAGALHNIRGTDQLFRQAVANVVASYKRAGVTPVGVPSLGPNPADNACLGCHYGVETASKVVFGEKFDHAAHVVRADVACKECHTQALYFTDEKESAPGENRDVDPRHGKTTLVKTSCESCHHSPTAQVTCASCHTADERLGKAVRVSMALKLKPANAPTSRTVLYEHSVHAKIECTSCHVNRAAVREVKGCASCHTDHHKEKASSCASCHGTTMLADHKMDSHFKCASCHERETVAKLLPDRAFCLSCHVKQQTHEPGRECAPCHLQIQPGEVRRRILAAPRTTQSK